MRIYYINLAQRTDRRRFMESQFEKLGLLATRIEAVAPQDLTAADVQRYCNPERSAWLVPTQLCCGLSHQRVAATLLEQGARHALVLEDDAVLSGRLPSFLRAFAEEERPDVNLLRIETTFEPMRLARSGTPDIAGIALMRLYSWAVGTCGYIISRMGAEAIAQSPEFRFKPADQVLSNPYEALPRQLGLLQSNPGLAVQAERMDAGTPLGSTINPERDSPQYAGRNAVSFTMSMNRHIVGPARKTWHQYISGARKHDVPFSP
jgi:glycosyl transferase, family 25